MGFFSDDISNALLLVSIALIFPTVICMRWHPGWWVVCVGTLSLLLNVVLAADGGFEAFNIDGTGRKTAMGAAAYATIASFSSVIGTYRMKNATTKAEKRHVVAALVLSGSGGVATVVLVGLQQVYKAERPLQHASMTLCVAKAPICAPRFAVAVALLGVSLAAQIIIECLDEEEHQQLEWVLQLGRIAGLVGFLIILVGAYRSYRPYDTDEPANLYGRLTLMNTVTAPYLGYAATSWVHTRTRRAHGFRHARRGRRGGTAADAAELGEAAAAGPPAAYVAPPPVAFAPPPPMGTPPW